MAPGVFKIANHLLISDALQPVLSVHEQRAIAARTKADREREDEQRRATQKANHVNFSDWPTEFQSVKDALDTYNRLGLEHRIMFKVDKTTLLSTGLQARFSLCCVFSKLPEKKRAQQNGQLNTQHKCTTKCPVVVHFRYKQGVGDEPGRFVRSHHMTQQHNHSLVLEERRVLARAEILDSIKLFVKSGLTYAQIVNCVNNKFGLDLSYHSFANTIRSCRQEMHSFADFSQT